MRGACQRTQEDTFGPVVEGCLDNFDFTLLFEETILFILPASCLLLLALVWRFPVLICSKVVIRRAALGWGKLTAYSALLISQIIFLVFVSVDTSANTRATISVTAVWLFAIVVMGLLSYLEHRRSYRPSSVLTLYLLATSLMNAARCRTLWNMTIFDGAAISFLVSTVLVGLALALEVAPKDRLLLDHVERPSPEQLRGIIERSLFLWMLPVFAKGYRHLFTAATLPTIDPSLARRALKESLIDSPDKSLLQGLLRVHWKDLLKPVIPRLCYAALTLAQPFLVRTATVWVTNPTGSQRSERGGGLIGAYALVYLGLAVTYALYRQGAVRAAAAMRASLTDFIFQRLSHLNSAVDLAGSATTLVSADIERIQFGVRQVHEIWANFITAAIALWLIETSIGVAMVPALGVAIVTMFVTLIVSVLGSQSQKIWFKATGERVSQVVKILADFRSVKMMGYTARLVEDLGEARLHEVSRSQNFRAFVIVIATLAQASTALVPAFGFGTYVLLNRNGTSVVLDGSVAFPTLTLFTILSSSVGQMLEAVFQVVTGLGCLARIGTVCNKYYRTEPRHILDLEKASPSMVAMQDASAKYDEDGEDIIHKVSFDVQSGTIVRIDGATASGKSTLLKMILGEMSCSSGHVVVREPRIGYCSQHPWIDNATIRDNIVGPAPFDPERYKNIIRICALELDLWNIPGGDSVLCLGNGATLSGGQKARISLARALYACPRIVILDDCMSGLDANTEHLILENLLGANGFFREHAITAFFVSNSRKLMSYNIAKLCLGSGAPVLVDTADEQPSVDSSSYGSKTEHSELFDPSSEDDEEEQSQPVLPSADGEEEGGYKRGAELGLYLILLRVGGKFSLSVFTLLVCAFVLGVTYPQIYIESYVRRSAAEQHKDLGEFVGIYFGLAAASMLSFAAACAIFTLAIAPRLSITFHHSLADSLLRAPLVFFSKTDSGSITNRFAQDLAVIDQEIPLALIGTTVTFLQLLAQCVTLVIGSHYSGFAIPVLLIIVWWIQSLYLPTSYQLRLLDLEAKAPIVSLFVRSIEGLATIRAFGWMEHTRRLSKQYITASQAPFYLLATAQNTLSLVLDLLTAVLAVIVISIAVATRNTGIGLSLFSLVGLGSSTKLLIATWTELETSLGAMKRIEEFSKNTPRESESGKTLAPPPDWPSEGQIEFSDVCLAYSESSPAVTSDLTFKIEPGQKVGICGRTGSGKSTLIASILGLIHVQQGSILIDGTDISLLEREKLRSSITVAPQNAVILHDDVRTNLSLNAKETPTDEQMIELLETYGLYDKFRARDGLATIMEEDILSHGEQQLFSLVRALIHKSCLILLDECTSKVDGATQQIIEDAVMSGFEGCTLLYVAHRLEILSQFDRVMVMDQGRIAEFDDPQVLLQNPDSLFASTYWKAASPISTH